MLSRRNGRELGGICWLLVRYGQDGVQLRGLANPAVELLKSNGHQSTSVSWPGQLIGTEVHWNAAADQRTSLLPGSDWMANGEWRMERRYLVQWRMEWSHWTDRRLNRNNRKDRFCTVRHSEILLRAMSQLEESAGWGGGPWMDGWIYIMSIVAALTFASFYDKWLI